MSLTSMDSLLSEVGSLESEDRLYHRWKPEMFQTQNYDKFENGEDYCQMLEARRKHLELEFEKIRQLTPLTYDTYCQRIQGPQLSPIREQSVISASKSNETSYLQFERGPIILKDPDENELSTERNNHLELPKGGDDEPSNIRCTRPYLKRGAGLARFHMSKNDFQKPPKLYQKKEFKSYLKGSRRKVVDNKIINPPKQAIVTQKKPAFSNVSSAPTAVTKSLWQMPKAPNSFDDEVIPTLRKVHERNIEKLVAQPPFRVPKAPMQHLNLKKVVPEIVTTHDTSQEENRIFELLEQRVEESDFCSQNSSVQKLFEKPEFPQTLKPKKLGFENIRPDTVELPAESKDNNSDHSDVEDEPEPQNKFKIFSQHDLALRVKRKALQDNVKKILECSYNRRTKATGRKFVKKIRIKKTVRSPKKDNINPRELKNRLVELEKEKNAFMVENNKLKRIQKEILDDKIQLDKKRKEDEKRLADERNDLLKEKEALVESQKKFYREKVVFEKYCRETKNLPSREEREEIRKLKEEIERLKEISNTRESRYGTAQARMRNQIKALESENKQLKKDLAEARTTTFKKVSFDSHAAINSKVINAINQQLGKRIYGTKSQASVPPPREENVGVRKPLRRTKSAAELKGAKKSVKDEPKSRVSYDADRDEVSDRDNDDDEPRIIDMLGTCAETSGSFKRSESADSGMCSRPSASDDDDPEQQTNKGCSDSTARLTDRSHPATARSAIDEIQNRVQTIVDRVEVPHCEPFRGEDCRLSAKNDPCCCTNIHCGAGSRSIDDRPVSKVALPNGDTEEVYANGKKRLLSKYGDFIRITYPNGNIREQFLRSQREKFFYKDTGVWLETFTDMPGYQKLDMPDGRTVVYQPDGNVDTLYPNGATARLSPNGSQEWRFKTGEIVRTDANGDKILIFPDGRKEFSSKEFTRLEENDGSIKTIYKDGRQETKLPNGRVRIKDRHGNIIMDTAGFNTVRG